MIEISIDSLAKLTVLEKRRKEGKVTISEAARKAGISVWDMEKYLVDSGFKSSYNIEDLKKELKI